MCFEKLDQWFEQGRTVDVHLCPESRVRTSVWMRLWAVRLRISSIYLLSVHTEYICTNREHVLDAWIINIPDETSKVWRGREGVIVNKTDPRTHGKTVLLSHWFANSFLCLPFSIYSLLHKMGSLSLDPPRRRPESIKLVLLQSFVSLTMRFSRYTA